MQRNFTPLLILLIALGTLAGLYGGYKRYHVEALNKAVEITLDFDEIRSLSAVTGRSLPQALAEFKNAGADSAAITEDTLGSLATEMRIRPVSNGTTAMVYVPDSKTLERIRIELGARGIRPASDAPEREPSTFFRSGPDRGFGVSVDWGTLREIGVGISPEVVEIVTAAGLDPVARIGNFDGVSAARVAAVLTRLRELGIKTVVFQGTEVLGFRGLHKETAAALDAEGINFGWIEFGKQKGEERLGSALQSRYVRVHSISETELGTLTEQDILERFVKAGRERNIRLLYARLPNRAGDDPIAANAEFLRKLSRGLERGALLQSGTAHAFAETGVPTWAFALMALGAAAGFSLLLVRFARFPSPLVIGMWAIVSIACLGLVLLTGESGRKLTALLAAIVFPTLACLRRDLLELPTESTDSAPVRSRSQAAVRAVQGLLVASAVTAIGIAHVLGLLATRPFLVKTQQFMGIKAAHAIPVLIIGVIAMVGLPRLQRAWAQERALLGQRIRGILAEPTRVGQILVTLFAMAALLVIVARTGNEPGVGVSGIEMRFRSILDQLLGVRPRTKEFLIGHPAFVLGLALWFRGNRRLALPLFVVGVLGQVSILNTFCHIHTPLTISLIRDITGLVIGGVLGLIAFFILDGVLLRGRDPEPAEATLREPASAAAL